VTCGKSVVFSGYSGINKDENKSLISNQFSLLKMISSPLLGELFCRGKKLKMIT
jgi:hypothetical protein